MALVGFDLANPRKGQTPSLAVFVDDMTVHILIGPWGKYIPFML
jgi:hypothetical protein